MSDNKNLSVSLPDNLAERLKNRASALGMSEEALAKRAVEILLSKPSERGSLYLNAPVNALVEGIYEENTSIEEILKKGDFGLGTFNKLDGEMMVLDGEVFQIKSDGKTYRVAMDTQTPFAGVTFFTPDTIEEVEGDYPYDKFNELLDGMLPSKNMLYAIRIEGEFEYVKTRSVPRQESYRPLVEVARMQPTFEFENVKGVLAGFFTPEFMGSVSVPGVHLHFLNEDRSMGGHLLTCHLKNGTFGIQHIPTLELGLPVTLDYLTADFTRDTGEDLEEAEKDKGN